MKLNLKNYRMIQKIGHGGMGLVYVAEDLALGRLVALKVLAPYLVQDPEILARFRTEARNQARLIHANITMVYSFLEEDQQAFLVLEFIDGETLESRINREGRIAAVEAVAIFRKILAAIAYAHSKGVIHRDIKPSNIAFTSDGHVKLMDFGIALNVEEGGRLTRTGHVMGTPHYMAPEQILGQEVTFATDIYALGITLYEMLTGRLPFDSKSDYEVRIAQVNHPPPPPRSFGHPDITPELEEVILKSLAKAPEDRFGSAREFLQALEESVGRDHLVTVVKGQRLDRTTQAVKKPRKSAPPPSESGVEEPPTPSPEPEIEASVPALASSTAEPIVPLEPQMEASPVSHHSGRQEISLSQQPEQLEEFLAPSPPPAARKVEEIITLPAAQPEVQADSRAPAAGRIAELGVSSHGEPGRAELLSPPPGAPSEDHFGPPPLRQPPADAVSPPDELPPQALVCPLPLGPPVEEPLPEPAGPLAAPEVERGRSTRSRLIFLPLALLPLLAITILFRANIFPGSSVTPKAMRSPPSGATAVQQGAPPAHQPEEEIRAAAAKPPAQPLNPVSKETAASTGAESDNVARDQSEKKEPVTMAALPPAEQKKETPEVKEANQVDLQKTIKERLAADGFPDLKVLMDAKKGAVISGKVKNLEQKNRVIRLVNAMGLSTPVDYSNLRIIREVVVETKKKKVEEERPRITRTPETSPRPAAPEAPHKPLPPRLDRGNIQF